MESDFLVISHEKENMDSELMEYEQDEQSEMLKGIQDI